MFSDLLDFINKFFNFIDKLVLENPILSGSFGTALGIILAFLAILGIKRTIVH